MGMFPAYAGMNRIRYGVGNFWLLFPAYAGMNRC